MLNQALQHCIKGDPDKSREILDQIADTPEAQFNIGWHEMRKGNFNKGMQGLSKGRFLNVFGSPPPSTNKPMWRGECLQGKKILLRGEGGFGDEIINLRFALDFKRLGAHVTVSTQPSMMSLLREQHYIDNIIHRDGDHFADFDYWVPAMSAAETLGYEYEDLDGSPYIDIPMDSTWAGNRIGIKLAGNPEFEHEQFRKFPPELMMNLTDNVDATFVSLEMEYVHTLENHECKDWLDTAKLIHGLDLVVTSCTGVAHLSAAMGIDTWVVVPIMPYYIWALPGTTSPWYNSVSLFRQEEFGDWSAPFEKIKTGLQQVFK